MDVTPSPKMLAAMVAFADAVVGPEPEATERGHAARKRKAQRRMVMDWLHDFSRLSMREGVARYLKVMGRPTVVDQVRPNPMRSTLEH